MPLLVMVTCTVINGVFMKFAQPWYNHVFTWLFYFIRKMEVFQVKGNLCPGRLLKFTISLLINKRLSQFQYFDICFAKFSIHHGPTMV